jgi:hypothetical protein
VRDEAETLERNPGGLTLAYDTREHAMGLGYLFSSAAGRRKRWGEPGRMREGGLYSARCVVGVPTNPTTHPRTRRSLAVRPGAARWALTRALYSRAPRRALTAHAPGPLAPGGIWPAVTSYLPGPARQLDTV